MHLNRECKEGLRGGSSTLDNKVKMITVAAAANNPHHYKTSNIGLEKPLEDLAYLSDSRIYFYV